MDELLFKLKKTYLEQLSLAQNSISEMESATKELREVKSSLDDIEKSSRDISTLAFNLRAIREENSRHSQLLITKENFKHIFDVPQNISTTRQFIAEGKLLYGHQQLRELEKSRYALLFELHKNPNCSPNDKITLKHYFSDIDKLYDEMGRQIWIIVRRAFSCVRRDPQTIVSALRITEREEREDELVSKKHDATGFMPPGRPRQWRKRVIEILEEAVAERITGNQLETRAENKHWLVRHLEITRQMLLEDLRVVKVAFTQCFPPTYDIQNLMLKLYHKCLRSHLLDLSHHLDGNEYVHLLNWVQSYPAIHRQLSIDLHEDPLLPETNKQQLQDRYFATIEKNYREWMSNTINREQRDWSSSEPPEMDNDGHYHTTTPVFIYQMIDQHLRVAETVNQALEDRILALSMDQLVIFAQQYKDTIEKYCKIHFSDRGRFKYFTPYMVAITNNCSRIEQLFSKMEKSRASAVNAFRALRDEALDKLLKELFLDIGKEINQIGSQPWIDGKVSCIENICLTLDDYSEDYKHLRDANRRLLYNKLSYRLACEYTQALLTKTGNLGNRQLFCEKFIKEVKRLEERIPQDPNNRQRPFQPLEDIREFLRLRDPDLLSLEVQNLTRKYPDMNEKHLSALLALSGIVNRRDCLREAKRMLEAGGAPSNNEPTTTTIFSEIQLPS